MDESKEPALLISEGVVVSLSNELVVNGRIELHGEIEGNIACEQITIGPTGRIKGRLIADAADIKGEVSTELKVALLTLRDGARVSGKVEYVNLTAELGAQIDAQLSRKQAPEQPLIAHAEAAND